MRKFRSKEVPQANDITRVIEIIYAIDRLDIGASLVKPRYINIAYDLVKNKSPFLKKNLLNNTDSDNIAISSSLKRDVAYYKDAADILGLSKSANNQLFQRFLTASDHQKRIILKNAILESEVIKTYLSNRTFKKFRKFVYTPDESYKKYDSRKWGISDDTLIRRISSLEAWLEYCDLFKDEESDLEKTSSNEPHIILIEKDNQKLERAVNAHKNLVDMMKNHLSSKNALVYEDNLVDLIFIGKEKYFFEMKSITDENKGSQLKKALGQLIYYKNYYNSNARLVVVVEKYFEDINILINDSIDVIWKDDYFFDADKKTKKKLNLIFNENYK
tara:strand:- start:64 stop:1056 length:993 start_codon:yes stop_codon:yes gene_type:complete